MSFATLPMVEPEPGERICMEGPSLGIRVARGARRPIRQGRSWMREGLGGTRYLVLLRLRHSAEVVC